MSGIQENIMQMEALKATMQATERKIFEGEEDYRQEIARLREQQTTRETALESEIGRAKEIGVAALTERGAQAGYETRMATMKAEQTASAGESRIAAGGIRASGTALAAKQQETDIAYAGAQRIAEAGAAEMKIGGLQLGNQLTGAREQKSLLTMGYRQGITEQQRKLTELEKNAPDYMKWTLLGGMAGISSNFYQSMKDTAFKVLSLAAL